ncbi:MAG: BrnT family toxin [Chloroflexota bacterium]|nr:BrnT family toxin [Chloroflexota bacterium]
MEFEWDEAKRRSNIEKHRIDFRDVEQLFDGRPAVTVETDFLAEDRYRTTGLVDARLTTVIWTQRSDRIRLISARGARDGEKREYRALYGS